MQKQFELTKQIHAELDRLAEKYGEKVDVKGRFYYSDEDHIFYYNFGFPQEKLKNCLPKLDPDSIRSILRTFKDELGENSNYITLERKIEDAIDDGENIFMVSRLLGKMKSNQAEALCQKWLDGLNPMFKSNEEQVLTELLKTLKSI